jgi:hypothetical protein
VAKGQILQYAIGICGVHHATAAETAAAFGVFGLQQVPFARARAHDFTPRGYFKPFGNSFSRFNAFGTSHIYNNPLLSKGREI